ncbi:unnamed protein product [Moneuplotes crassus]|uniref:Uncharacterized protein n=1 Tax=Euplotes crassus TaxID=5936 RepID=A0AAD1XVA1_EUPCR|nr:unnamed protein product [Moneuplotes crassus]
MANNFRFHDKSLRAAGHGMKAISCTKRMKGSEIATIMNKVGSKVSWIRQTLRIGSEFAIYKGLFQMFKKKATTNPLEWWSQLLEYFIGVYFYIIDHIDWASTNHLLKISKAWKSWITLESTRAWLYSTIAITIHRLAGIYNACKTLKQADKLNLSDQQKQKIRKTRKTLIFMFIKGLVDFGHITYYLKPEIAARDSISYFLGVVSSFMDIFMILNKGSL